MVAPRLSKPSQSGESCFDGESCAQKEGSRIAPRDKMPAHSSLTPATWEIFKLICSFRQKSAVLCNALASGCFMDKCFAVLHTTPKLSHCCRREILPIFDSKDSCDLWHDKRNNWARASKAAMADCKSRKSFVNQIGKSAHSNSQENQKMLEGWSSASSGRNQPPTPARVPSA